MPTSATGRRRAEPTALRPWFRGVAALSLRPRPARGFSLVELLVTLIIIVLFTSFVSLNVGFGGQDVRVEAQMRQFADTAAYALDEAQFTGVDYGFTLERVAGEDGDWRHAWRWYERAVDGWRPPVSGKEIFAEQRLPPGYELELEVENAPFEEAEGDAEERDPGPQVVFYASGETTVGAINLRRIEDGELLWRLEWDLLGRMDLLPRGLPAQDEDG